MPSLTPISRALGSSRASYLLQRLTFGASPQQLNSFAGMSVGAALIPLLNFTLPDPPSYEGDV